MPESKNPLKIVHHVMRHVQTSPDAQREQIEGAGLAPEMARLRVWQAQRIANTYKDFSAQKEYAAAMRFFLQDIYAPRDFSQRDHDAERAYTFLKKIVPAEMLSLFTDSRALIALTYDLDDQLNRVLVEQLGSPDPITADAYAEAYRQCDNYPARAEQIELLLRVMHDGTETARFPLTGAALRIARGPAHSAGWHDVYGFLERGHNAFRHVKHPERLLKAIEQRETRIMRRIATRIPDPFDL